MEERKREESAKDVLDFKCQEILPEAKKSIAMSPAPVQRKGIVGSQHLETKIVSMTPEKTTEPLHITHKKEAVELPEKYRTLLEFFDRMTCSLRLLTLCKKLPTFRNICIQVEKLTGRKFSCRHLAQMKYILPEALQTAKILIHDEKTMCMNPELIVTLIFDCVEGHNEQSNFTALCQHFASKLVDFFSTHPEGCEIPESLLPEPFDQRRINISTDSLPMDSSSESQLTSIETGLLSSTHLYPSFCRRLSQQTGGAETEKTSLLAFPLPLSSIKYDCMTNQDSESGQQKTYSTSSSKSGILTNPLQLSYSPRRINSTASENTPMKLASEAEKLMIETPAQSTPKRSVPSENKLKDILSEKWMASNVIAKRSLDFSHLEGEDDCSSNEKTGNGAVSNIIPQTVETKRTSVEYSVTCFAAALQKVEENSCFTSKDYETNQSGLISHQRVSASLSDLVGLIHRIFQSANCASITKEELVHKIIINNYDIVERREVEEQIERLEELVPDWICRKLLPSGDLLYNIKKVSDLNSVRERLIIM